MYIVTIVLLLTNLLVALGEYETLSGNEIVVIWVCAISAAVTLMLWPLLRWRRRPGAWRMVASLAFALASIPQLTGGIGSTVVITVVTIHLVYVFGSWGGIAHAALISIIGMAVHAPLGSGWGGAIMEGVVAGLLAVWAIGVAHLLLSRERNDEQTRRLLRDQVEAHDRLRRYTEQVRELTVAQERARMSREMHDSVGHYLTVIGLQLRNALRYHQAGRVEAWEEVRQTQVLAQEALDDTRRWVRALRPLALENGRPVMAMEALAEAFSSSELSVNVVRHADFDGVDESVELVMYRVLQEGLTNVLRHSGADRVDIDVSRSHGFVSLVIADNGRGAPVGESGMGLTGLRERVSELDGTLAAVSPAAGGHRLEVRVPEVALPDLVGAS